ncbi:D-alanyl-D-alanine dipeptidase [Streptomyces sp. TSRI0384-2]|uniref:D-alanyl-D-alanine dipeptidase n=1 Tax=Streptomyces diastaticus subsp. diastaticus TaxID=68040 RepID=A0ABQ1CPE4_STRDI|nr:MULTISPECIES: M15 family metallopeptidase [Streptomyces]PJM82269.1 D-alanyl-D-alanine dipeptidase [Streptomyces sp. TSRI0384-2]RPK80497.1 D-alanyl-D-alanine dipeptidase [Streptomyces sp. ADI98-12]WPR50236.1 M15 family metallopeptidase [Streptomyces sp. S399]GFH72150.1 D-alanyl-D-alanine dipeptidase [Streptomyces diastaticus subsp. diastaticus]GGU29648.1 D-alanyl-D-alanine dipeptidase [Streptomyces diastaticus subsp. diastaticus]
MTGIDSYGRTSPGRRPSRARRAFGAALAAAALALTAAATASPATAAPVADAPPSGGPKAPRGFVALSDVAPTILQEIRYTTPHNFVGEPVDGYRAPMCLVTRPTAEALKRAQRGLLREGYSLKVYDCYRPQRAVDHFVRWAEDVADERMKAEFYPRVEKSRLFEDGYIAEKSGHSRGSTVDLTLVKLPAKPTRPYLPGEPLRPCFAPRDQRFPDNSVDMGTGFDCFDTLSHTDDPRVTGAQRAHRDLLRSALAGEGFTNLPEEWWHFTHRPELFPDTYFDFPVERRSLPGGHRH